MLRKRYALLCLAIAVGLATLLCIGWQQVTESPLSSGDEHPSSEILVRLHSAPDEHAARQFFARRDLGVVKHIPRIDVWVVTGLEPTEPAAALAHRLEQSADVAWAEPNGQIYAVGVINPNDNFYLAQQWNLQLIRLPETWAFTTGDTAPVAVLDTGIDLDHPDLAAKLWVNADEIPNNGQDDDENGYVDDVHGWNFVTGSSLLIEEPHGTHVAGIIGAHTDNEIGVAGVSWQSTLMSLQVLRNKVGYFDDLAEAIVYAADNGARVLNLSLGGDESSSTVDAAISYAHDQGCLLVAVAGNNSVQPHPVLYPASAPGVLAVAATTDSDVPWSSGNRGSEVDLAAPGVSIYSTSSDGQYASMTGTSMAAPHVSGLAALIWSVQPELTADQVAHVITRTARDVYTPGWDPRTGWGRIDALVAILEFESYHLYLPLVGRPSPGKIGTSI
jgi:subtilisin family serine protease